MANFGPWQYVLANTADMSEIGPLNAKNKGLTLEWNRPGTAKYSIYDSEPYADQIVRRKTCIIAKRFGIPQWSGQNWSINYNANEGKLDVGCTGWLKVLENDRKFRPNLQDGAAITYTDTDDGLIIHNILDKANEQGPNMTGAATSTFMVKGIRETGQVRTRKYEEWQSFGQSIYDLCDIENGRDIWVDPITRALNVYTTRGSIKPALVWGFNAGPSNLANTSIAEDGSRQLNRMNALGKYAWGLGEDYDNQLAYGLIESNASLSEVVDINILLAYANAEVAVRAENVVHEIFPKQWTPDLENNVPQPFVDYNMGDTGYFSMKTNRYDIIEQPVRVFGMDISIDDDGNEKINKLTTNLG